MKKILLFLNLIFIVYLCIFPKLSFAQQFKWNKYPTPVLQHGDPGSWDSSIHTAAVIYNDGKYKMWYGGWDGSYGRIGYAWSNNGIEWNKYPTYILDVTSGETQVGSPTVIFDEEQGNFKMWFLSAPNQNILYAESPDGIHNWERKQITGLYKTRYWENQSHGPGTVMKIIDTYYLWYTGVGSEGIWRIGVATSPNGLNWTQYINNPISGVIRPWEHGHNNHPAVVLSNNTYYFWYHSGESLNVSFAHSQYFQGPLEKIESENPAIPLGENLEFDSKHVNRPAVININGIFHMWYSGQDSSDTWSIGYATTGEFPSNLNPIVVIPGMFASWNSRAIIENEDIPQDQWTMTPFVNDYDGIIETLKSAGYSNNILDPKQNLFVFNYDWRKPVEETALQFNDYLHEYVLPKNPQKQVYLVGHSLGGLVGRAYLQNYDDYHVQQLITLGTPHSGAIQTYKAWEGGVVDNNNVWERLALEIILGINRDGSWTNKDIIREIAPVVHDLLPTFDYLKDANNQTIHVNSLKQQNLWLANLENNFPNYFDRFYSIYGETGKTPEWYKVIKNNPLENLLGLWQDGKPTDIINTAFGDEVVLSKSATRSADPALLITGVNHRKLVSEEEAITALMNKLEVEPATIITPSPSQPIFPSLFFALKSPAIFKVIGPSGTFESDQNKIIFIPDALGGNYQIEVKGLNPGKYNLLIGELGLTNSVWKEVSDTTNTDELDTYTVFYDPNNPPDDPVVDQNGLFYLNNAYNSLDNLKDKHPHWTLLLALHSLKNAQQQFEKGKFDNSADFILKAINHLFIFRKRQTLAYPLNTSFSIIKDLSISYEKILSQTKTKINRKKIESELMVVEILKKAIYEKLKYTGNEQKAQVYLLGEKMLNSAKTNFEKGNFAKAEIEVYIAKLLFLEV